MNVISLINHQSDFVSRMIPLRDDEKENNSVFTLMSSYFANIKLFDKSILVKELEKKLQILHISQDIYRYWKGLSLSIFIVFCIFLSILFAAEISLIFFISFLIVSIIIGFNLPDLYIYDRLLYRKFEVYTQLPNFFDLLHLTLSSGGFGSFSEALVHVSQNIYGILAKDLKYLASIQEFSSRDEVLSEIEMRFEDNLMDDLVVTLRLTYEYGGDLANKVKVLADEAHKTRLIKAKETANKAAATLLIPIIVFQLPVILIIFLLPTVMGLDSGIF